MNLGKQNNMFTETRLAENAEDIKEDTSEFDLDFDLGKLSVSPLPYEPSCLGADDSSVKMITSDVSGAELLSALDSIGIGKGPELRDSVTKGTVDLDNFDTREADLNRNDSSTADFCDSALAEPSSRRNGEAEVLVETQETQKENHPLIVYTSSRRRSARNNKLNQNNAEPEKPSRSCRRIAPKKSTLEFNSLQIARRKRSLFSKRARSSVWGNLGNIVPDYEEHSTVDVNTGNDNKPRRARGVNGNKKTIKDQKENKSKAKSCIPTGHISLKIKIGNQRCDLLNVAESFNASEKSAGEVVTEDMVLKTESNMGKLNSADASVFSTHVDLTGDHLSNLNQTISLEEGDNLGASAENRCSDSGTSPDSEVINSVPDGPLFEKDLQNMQGSPTMNCAPLGDVSSLSLQGAKSKKGKNKDKLHQVGKCCVEGKQTGEVMDNVRGGVELEVGSKMGDVLFADPSMITTAKQYPETYCSKEFPLGPMCCSGIAAEKPSATLNVLDEAEKSPPSGCVRATESLDSLVCDTLPCINGVSFPKYSKANGGSKSRSAVPSLPNRKDIVSKKKGSKNNSRSKHQVDACSPYRGVESHLAAGKQMSYDLEESRVQSKVSGGSLEMLQISSNGEMDQYVAPRNAWVLCDECQKWRRIPAALADQIEETNCGWTCKQNMDKDFADCSIPQEKSNSEINEELEISDASGEEDASDTFPKSNQNRSMGLSVADHSSWSLIKSNVFLHRSRKTQTIDEVMVCHCIPPSDGRMGCGAKCLNRMLNIECVRGTCPCGELCSNQQFQRRKYAKLKWFKCGKKGYGLQALENISEGQFLIEYVGEVLDSRAYEARQREYGLKGHKHFYFMTLKDSEVIDACAKGNLGRFINHSCAPNCRTEKWMVNGEVCIGLFALRDIKKGEEVTFDYNYVRVCGAAAKKCVCGSPNCRGYIGGDPTNSEVIVQGDSDDEYYEPVMTCEDSEMTEDWNNILLNAVSNREPECAIEESENRVEMKKLVGAVGLTDSAVEMPTSETLSPWVNVVNSCPPDECLNASTASDAVETVARDKFVVDNLVGNDHAGKLDINNDKEEFLDGFPSDTSKIVSLGLLDSLHSSSPTKNISPLSDESKRKVKYSILGERDELAKSNSVPKPRLSSSIKKRKPKADVTKGSPVVNKPNAGPTKFKRLPEVCVNNNLETVEGTLNDLLDAQGGISKRKDASRGYLKLLFLTAASGNNGHGEAIQSNRDLSMILDALLKTKSRTVLVDIINKNGVQMLHNIMKRCRKEFIKTPILRKLLKVLEYLAMREILTLEHITGGPRCPGVESFKDSILTLTEHADKQVHQIARNFRDRWIPRSLRKTCCMERDDARNEFHQRSYGRLLPSSDHLSDRGGKPSESKDSCEIHLLVPSGTVENSTVDHTASGSDSGVNGTKTRKRKSRWDTPSDDFPHSKPKTDLLAGDAKLNVDEDVPPGFSSPCNGRLVPSDASSTPSTHRQREAHITHPFNVVLGTPQHRYSARIPVSYGIPSYVMQQFGVIQPKTLEAWTVAPAAPFHPFPPLPPNSRDKEDCPVSSAKCVPLGETAEKAGHVNGTCVAHHAGQKHGREWDPDQPEMNASVASDQSDLQRLGGSFSLGRKYFRQQKWNHSKLAPPWVRMRSGWGHGGNSSRNCAQGVVVGNGSNEVRNTYNSEDVSWRGEI